MKIVYVMNSGNFGGMEQHVVDLAKGMKDLGNEVHVWCPKGPISTELRDYKINVREAKIALEIDPLYIFRLFAFLRKFQPDIIHVHELKATANALIASFFAGSKTRITHTHTPISEWRVSAFAKSINLLGYKIVVNLFSTVEIALTESRKKVKISEGISEKKLAVIESANAIHTEQFRISEQQKAQYKSEIRARHNIPENAIVWGFVSRISEEKGHEVLIEAFRECLNNISEDIRSNHYLVLVGGGPQEDRMKELVAGYGLSDRVIVTGRFSDEDKIKYYSSLDYFVHPSLAEGFGIALVEAMAIGAPVIASDLEVFDEVSAGLVSFFETGNMASLCEKMLLIHSNSEHAQQMASQAKERAHSLFSLENFTRSYNEFYLELLSK